MTKELKPTTCDKCGDLIDFEAGENFKTLDIPLFLINQLRFQRPDLASTLERQDGKLTLHSNCNHEIEQFLEPVMTTRVEDTNTENLQECPVCGISIWNRKSGCERCGHSFEEETLVKS